MRFILLLLSLATNHLVWTQQETTPTKSYTTTWTDNPPSIDGSLDDDAWSTVDWGGDFVGHQPDYLSEPSQDTKFKILYDEKFLYVGVRAYDSNPEEIVRRMSRRDGFDGDWVEINIDSYGDKRTAFSFTASVSGVKGDEYVSNNGDNWDSTWDPIWFLKTSIDTEGWIAEFKIPLSQLRFANREAHTWGIQLTRRFFRDEERWTWQPVDPNAPGWVHLFGELNGITGIKPQKQLEIMPYVVGATSRFPKEEGNPYRDTGTSTEGNIGVDAKIGLTSDITLDLTINPDFGQVDADPSAVNLSAFQLFFREQRPFFLEGNNILEFGTSGGINNLFYSRRIGARPQGSPDDVEYIDAPNNTRILAAAKLTGKNSKAFSWGVQQAVTQRTYADVTNSLGQERREVIEPMTSFTVGRFQQDLNEGKTVFGAILSNVSRFDNRSNGLELLHDDAQSAGVDLNQDLWNRKYSFNVRFGGSRVHGTQGAIYQTQTALERNFQRPDNNYRELDTTRTELVGSFAALTFGRQDGNWNWRVGSNYRSPELELNDIGFLQRTDNWNHWFFTRYQINDKTKLFRFQNYNFYAEQNYDFGGTLTSSSFDINMGVQFHNYWNFNTGFYREGINIANSDLRGGPALAYPGGTNWWYWIGTNNQRMIRLSWNHWFFWGDRDYTRNTGMSLNITARPMDALRISLSPNIQFRDNSMQYIESNNEGEGIYMLSRVEQNTYSMTIRANYNITPDLTLEFWGEPFISSNLFSDFVRVNTQDATNLNEQLIPIREEWKTYDFESETYQVDQSGDMVSDYSFSNPDFNTVNFRSNLVLRWEYIPGSVLFAAWSHNGSLFENTGRNRFNQLWGDLRALEGTNTFLIKYSYRFVL